MIYDPSKLPKLSFLALIISAAVAACAGVAFSASPGAIVFSSLLVGLTTTSIVAARSLFSHPEGIDPAEFRGTRKMSQRLQEIYRRQNMNVYNLTISPFSKSFKLPRYFSTRRGSGDIRAQVGVIARDAELLFVAGRGEEAIEKYLEAKKLAEANAASFDKKFFIALEDSLAMAYLRLGEQKNCIARHTAESCIVPIGKGGQHAVTEPSRKAIEHFLTLLEHHPEDTGYRWLLNLAYMTLGEYPEKVPAKYLVPMDLFNQRGSVKRFRDVASEVGLDLRGLAGGVVIDDFDNDGYLDVFLSGWELGQQLRYFHNNGDGSFTERTAEAGLTGITGGLNLLHADYNNDGNLDLLVLRGGWQFEYGMEPVSLLRNNGNGTFEDVTVEAGLLGFHPTQTAVWADFHNHGRLDLFVGYESVTFGFILNIIKSKVMRKILPYRPLPIPRHPCALFRNNGDGTFTNIAHEVGVDVIGLVKGVNAGDYNNDGWTDLYISRFGSPNILFRNNGRDASGKISFTDVTQEAGVPGGLFSFPTWFFDYNNDGWLDLYVGDSTERAIDASAAIADECLGKKHAITCLYRNNGDGTFTNVTAEAGVDKSAFTMGSNYGDLDNDGWLDFYLGTGSPNYRTLVPNRMFRNVEGKRFEEVTTAGGFGHIQKGHGTVFADLNEDGHQEVFISMGGFFTGDVAICALFENPGNDNHWVKLKLEGVKSNRCAIGARIKVTVRTAEGTRDIYSTVTSGGSFGGNPFRRELGLGQAVGIEKIEVKWPASGIVQTFTEVAMDKLYRVREGEPALELVELKRFKLGGGKSLSHAHDCCAE